MYSVSIYGDLGLCGVSPLSLHSHHVIPAWLNWGGRGGGGGGGGERERERERGGEVFFS